MCDRIKAPYNFVPLNGYVYIPEWADKISQDIPFSDGEDGMITVTFRNETPLFIHSGMNEKEAKNPWSEHVVRDGKKLYFLPATSIKGMVRSVMEVLSFAALDTFNDDYFGYRNFDTKIPTGRKYQSNMRNIRCGWLRKENDDFLVKDCGEVNPVETSELKERGYWFPGPSTTSEEVLKNNSVREKWQIFEEKILVCTGYIGRKCHEYLFPKPDKHWPTIKLSDDVKKKFLSTYKPSPYFKEKKDAETVLSLLRDGAEVPVFFIKKDNGIQNIGLSKMFRYPYDHNIARGIRQECRDSEGHALSEKSHDVCHCLFGYTDSGRSLKGRVQFGHAFASWPVPDDKLINVKGVLGTPSPSYYPLYLKHPDGRYKTYDDADLEIAGRKRYRIHKTGMHGREYITPLPEGNGNENTMSTMNLLPEGNTFVCRISVHNLRPFEIGALLSALTFHYTKGAYHNIGKGKSFGYGKLCVESVSLEGLSQSRESYLKEFELGMSVFTLNNMNKKWADTDSVKMLMNIASDHDDTKSLEYMSLEEYRHFKTNDNFSRLEEKDVPVNSLVDAAALMSYMNREREEAERQRKAQVTIRKKEAAEQIARLEASEDYDKALEICSALIGEIGEDEEVSSCIDTLKKKRQEKIEKERQIAAEQEKEEKVKKGLSFLEEKYDEGSNKGTYKVKDFKVLNKRVEAWLKISGNTTVPEDQKHYFIDALKRIYAGLKERDKKEWKSIDSKVWKFVREQLGEEKCSELFSQLIG